MIRVLFILFFFSNYNSIAQNYNIPDFRMMSGNERFYAPKPLTPSEMLTFIKNYEPMLISISSAEKDLEKELKDQFFNGIQLIQMDKYQEAIERFKRAKLTFEIFNQPYFLNQTKL